MLAKIVFSLVLLFVGASSAFAGQITSGFVSHHSERPAPDTGMHAWQESNLGIGYKSDRGFMAVVYVNSENRPGLLGAYEEELVRAPLGPFVGGGRLGVGAALGYKDMPVAPVAYPSAFLSVGPVELVIAHHFGLGKRMPSVTWLQARIKIK